MRKALKPPSEWLNLLCREWATENSVLVETTDAKFLDYKPYLKGLLSSQLLCRLSIQPSMNSRVSIKNDDGSTISHSVTDFWEILGISDSFDRAYIVAQVRRFPMALHIVVPPPQNILSSALSSRLNASVRYIASARYLWRIYPIKCLGPMIQRSWPTRQ